MAENIGLKVYIDVSNIFVSPVTLPVRAEAAKFKVTKIEPGTVSVRVNMLGKHSEE